MWNVAGNWIRENNIQHLAVHWDLDVLSPNDFRSIYPGKPYVDINNFFAAVGDLTLQNVGNLLNHISAETEIVGLSIAEHLPWDAMNLRKTLASIPIFQH